MNTCGTCKFWTTTDTGYIPVKKLGECKMVALLWDAVHWDAEYQNRVFNDSHKDKKAFVQDGSDYTAFLYTAPDFACNQWEAK